MHTNTVQSSKEWVKYLAIAMICSIVSIDGMTSAIAEGDPVMAKPTPVIQEVPFVVKSESVASRLGGFFGIHAFLRDRALPAILADSELAPFFGNLSETPSDIAKCFAMRLDHELGGSSTKSGTHLESMHRCRKTMKAIHKGRNIPDSAITKFIQIVEEQAAMVGVSPYDIKAVAAVLERNRAGIRNK